MKAWVYRRYGGPDVVQLEDAPTPEPKANEVLVRILATTVTAGDWRALTLEMPPGFGAMGRLVFGITRPRKPILGLEFAGRVERVGAAVTRFRAGDAVFGSAEGRMGCHAEFQTLAEDAAIAHKPEALSFETAAALPFGGATALYFLEKGALKPGERVLVLGAAGGVGTAVVQLAKHLGAHVTGVTSTPNLELVASIGADRVLDRTKVDPLATGDQYDIIVDTVGETPLRRCRHALRDGGRLLAVAGSLGTMVGAPLARGGRTVIAGVAPGTREVMEKLAELGRTGALRPVLDHVYEFGEMREAHARVASRRKRGNVVVRVSKET